MSRSHGRILSRIWDDRQFRALDAEAQRAYLFLLSQPDLNHAGLIPLRVKRWAAACAGQTPDDVLRALKSLAASRFVLVDEDTEEVLVRTFVRNDGVYKQPKVMIRMGDDARQIASPVLRAAFVVELGKLPIDDLDTPNQRAQALAVVRALVTEFGESDTPAEGYPEGYREGYPANTAVDSSRDYPDSASSQVDTLEEGYAEGYPEGLPIPPARAQAHSPFPLPPKNNPQPKDTPSPALAAEPIPLDGLLVTPDGATASDRRTLDDHFDEFWAIYPRKVGKDDARRVWDRARKRAPIEAILAGAVRLANDPNLPDARNFIPHATTWLTRGSWNDEPLPDRSAASGPVTAAEAERERLRAGWAENAARFPDGGDPWNTPALPTPTRKEIEA